MGAQENAATARRLNDAFNARDVAAAVALCLPDVEIVNVVTGEMFRGPEGVRQSLQGWYSAFPDSKITTKFVIADDSGAVIEFSGRGTQTGSLPTPLGTIPPTGRTVDLPFVTVAEMRQGKLARSRLYFDLVSMVQQLGLVREPAGTQAGT
jgi:steroid delta-isomerase-like uncharacterized protein